MIKFQGFSYNWHKNSFLTQPQVEYALERLWILTAGNAVWEDAPVINFLAINKEKVDYMLTLPANTMPWIPLVSVLPKDAPHHLDTESLPAICLVDESSTITYTGIGNYPLDLVAATFILLTCWEEWKYPELDKFGRHQEDATLCVRQNFRERPVLDEWAMMLQSWLKNQNPEWHPILPKPSIWMSHDIDHLQYYKNPIRIVRAFVRDIIHHRSLKLAIHNAVNGLLALVNPQRDPCFKAIYDLMDMDESLCLRGVFFFMSANSSKFDEGYDLSSNINQNLLKTIAERGHDIAWHPGFFSATNDKIFEEELIKIRTYTHQQKTGLRHHYLRWKAGESWKRMINNAITYDSSIGYNSHLGFRTSTSKFYPAYDLLEDKVIPLEVRPFAAMDGALVKNVQLFELRKLIQRAYSVNGCFAIIIHNYTVFTNKKLMQNIYSIIKNEVQ